MIVTCVYVRVKPDAIQSFIEATKKNHKESVKEPGNLRFDLVQKEGDPCRFMIYEAYESAEAAEFHKATDHYLEWRDGVKDMMADPRMGVRYNIVEPADPEKW